MEKIIDFLGSFVVCAVFFLIIGSIGFDRESISEAYAEGYEDGYEEAYIIGYDAGHEDGRRSGSSDAYEAGYEAGKEIGHEIGYEIGYDSAAFDYVTYLDSNGSSLLGKNNDSYLDIVYATPWGSHYHKKGCEFLTIPMPIRYGNAQIAGFEPCETCFPHIHITLP